MQPDIPVTLTIALKIITELLPGTSFDQDQCKSAT
jgi:hypothetical protein